MGEPGEVRTGRVYEEGGREKNVSLEKLLSIAAVKEGEPEDERERAR